MINAENYTVELSGPGLSMKRELSEPVAHELLVWLLKGGKLQSTTPSPQYLSPDSGHQVSPAVSVRANAEIVSVREFMDQYSPGRVPDKIACFGLYLKEHRNQKEFSKEDLVGLFQEAADPTPKNLTRDIRWAQQIAWVAPTPSNQNLYYLTKKGEDAVRASFAKEFVLKTRLSLPTRRRRGATPDEADSNSTQID